MNMLIMSVIKHQTIIKCDSVQNTILFSLGLDSSGGGAVHMQYIKVVSLNLASVLRFPSA